MFNNYTTILDHVSPGGKELVLFWSYFGPNCGLFHLPSGRCSAFRCFFDGFGPFDGQIDGCYTAPRSNNKEHNS